MSEEQTEVETTDKEKIIRQYSQVCHDIGDLIFKTEMNKKTQEEIDEKIVELKQKQKVINARYMEAVAKEKKAAEKEAKSVIVSA